MARISDINSGILRNNPDYSGIKPLDESFQKIFRKIYSGNISVWPTIIFSCPCPDGRDDVVEFVNSPNNPDGSLRSPLYRFVVIDIQGSLFFCNTMRANCHTPPPLTELLALLLLFGHLVLILRDYWGKSQLEFYISPPEIQLQRNWSGWFFPELQHINWALVL